MSQSTIIKNKEEKKKESNEKLSSSDKYEKHDKHFCNFLCKSVSQSNDNLLKQKDVESIINSYSQDTIYQIQAASGYPLCSEHYSLCRYINTTEPKSFTYQMKVDILSSINKNHSKCSIFQYSNFIFTDSFDSFKIGMGIIYINKDLKQYKKKINEETLQNVLCPNSINISSSQSMNTNTNSLSKDSTFTNLSSIHYHHDPRINIDDYYADTIESYDTIYVPIYKQKYCSLCNCCIGYISNIQQIQGRTVLTVIPLQCYDTCDISLYNRGNAYKSSKYINLYGNVNTIEHNHQSQTQVFIDSISIYNPRHILATFLINTINSYVMYNQNIYSLTSTKYMNDPDFKTQYILNERHGTCHYCRQSTPYKTMSICKACNCLFCNQCSKNCLLNSNCIVCSYTCNCTICHHIFIKQSSSSIPNRSLRKARDSSQTDDSYVDPFNSSIHFFLRNTIANNNIGDLKQNKQLHEMFMNNKLSENNEENYDLNIYFDNQKLDTFIILSLFSSIQTIFPKVYIPTGNILYLYIYLHLYVSFCESHSILYSNITDEVYIWIHKFLANYTVEENEDIHNDMPMKNNSKENINTTVTSPKESSLKKKTIYPLTSSLVPLFSTPSIYSDTEQHETFLITNNGILKQRSHIPIKRLRFERSNIHSWGVFTDDFIKEKEYICEYTGEIIRSSLQDVRQSIYEKNQHNSDYMFKVDTDYIIDATYKGSIARFVNHSCEPNCYSAILKEGKSKIIVLFAKRDIQPGEELTYDYKFPFEDEKIPCNCGSSKCRGSLN